jgi:hypothetical protein
MRNYKITSTRIKRRGAVLVWLPSLSYGPPNKQGDVTSKGSLLGIPEPFVLGARTL